ncbi:questin oxidase family protein [Streptomyces sp. NPDC020801]|uniref:questin oxidase family protein n=1 Tax=unclassified Streptomyces TaxID=2593676 RepID=UPI0037A6BA66
MQAGLETSLEALEMLRDTGCEFEGYLSNHGPMASDALIAMGYDCAVVPWVDAYRRRLDAPASATRRIGTSEQEWRCALGDVRRVEDWIDFFRRELDERPWEEVLVLWWPRLAPGIAAAAAHGIIRTAHAVRALGRSAEPLPPLLDELARGLGYWACRYHAFPDQLTHYGSRPVDEAVEALPRLARDVPAEGPGIMGRMVPAMTLPHLTDVCAEVRLSDGEVERALGELTSAAARVFVRQPKAPIPLVHALTAPAALRFVLPHLPEAFHRQAFAAVWQLSAVIVAAFDHPTTRLPLPGPDTPLLSPDELAGRAAEHGDEHVIKMTEACIRENSRHAVPYYLHAAGAALERIEPLT